MYSSTTLIGRVGRDPKTGENASGEWAMLSVATDEWWKDGDGEDKSRTTWHTCFAHGKRSQSVAKLSKGDLVLIQGTYQGNGKERDGVKYTEFTLSIRVCRRISKTEAKESQDYGDNFPTEEA